MNANLNKIAKDLYGKIQTRFPDIRIGDENAAVLSKKEDIPNARFFEFEYKENGEPLGTIAITLDSDDGVVVQVSGDLVNDNDGTTQKGAYKFIRSFRQFAKDRLLNFDVQNIGKSNMDKRDYQFQAKRKEEPVMAQAPIMENKMYGNARMSYQDLGEARLVVKHSQPINLDLAAGRTMHIESIYIENSQGERFKYPFKHLNGARALAEHIKHGGTPYDAIGKHISSLSEELASLRKFKGFVSRQEQVSEAMGSVTGRVIDRIDQIKETIHKLQRSAYYEAFVESFEEQEEQMIPEEVQNDLINRLTVRTFNEELKSVFPYIAKFVKEDELTIVELDADDILSELSKNTLQSYGNKAVHDIVNHLQAGTDPKDRKFSNRLSGSQTAYKKEQEKEREERRKSKQPEDEFESFLEDIVSEDKNELFSTIPGAKNRAVNSANELLSSELSGGDMGVLAWKGLIDDPELIEKIRVLDQDEEIRQQIKDYVLDNEPELITMLTNLDKEPSELGGANAEAPVAPPAPAPAPAPQPAPVAPPATEPGIAVEPMAPAPVAESEEEKKGSWRSETPWRKSDPKKNPEGKVHNLAGQALKKTIEKAKKAGATLETQLDFGYGIKTLAEIIEESGMSLEDVGFSKPHVDGLSEMMKYISGFYNKDEGNFPLGGQRIKIKVKKDFEDGAFGNASEEDLMKILRFIDLKDPSGDLRQQSDIVRLAGIPGHAHSIDEAPQDPRLEKLQALLGQLASKVTTSQPVSGQSAMPTQQMDNPFKDAKLKFGDQELDLSNPDAIGGQVQNMLGGIMKGMNLPQGQQQLPGGMGSFDMGKMRDFIQQQMQQNKE
jgi:hypothetical protein